MALSFINPSRSYDADGRCVRFVGYDGMRSVSFAVEAGALSQSGCDIPQSAEQSLAAFDALRSSVQEAAREAYANSRQTTYVLRSADLR